MMPACSWAVPGRKPGTSTNVTSGMLKASQKRTNRAAFTDKPAKQRRAAHLVVGLEVCDAGTMCMDVRAAQLVEGDVFVGDRLHHVRAGHEHVARVADHDDEVGDGG